MANFTRRELLHLAAGASASACLGRSSEPTAAARPLVAKPEPTLTSQPVLFVSHGSPMAAVENNAYTAALTQWGAALARPKAIVVVSAHWQTRGGILVTTMPKPSTVHDFGGFPKELYALEYPAPGAPELAADVLTRLREAGFTADGETRRGLDHGAWVPLRRLAPDASIPVVQVSLEYPRSPDETMRVGAALASLRREGVLLVGSGGLVHNFDLIDWDAPDGKGEPWTADFDAWVLERVKNREFSALADYRAKNPYADRAAPTPEHFDPIFFLAGAAASNDALESVFDGYQLGTMSLRTFALRAVA